MRGSQQQKSNIMKDSDGEDWMELDWTLTGAYLHKHQTHNHAASGWRIHCGVEVTELSTNKQHTLSNPKGFIKTKCLR